MACPGRSDQGWRIRQHVAAVRGRPIPTIVRVNVLPVPDSQAAFMNCPPAMRNARLFSAMPIALAAAALFACEQLGLAQEFVPTPPETQVFITEVFALSGDARQPLPSVDCWHCTGPAPCAPCDGHRDGFLYYGTCHLNDGCNHGFNDAQRDYKAVRLARAWFHLRQRQRLVSRVCYRCDDSSPSCDNKCSP